MKVKRKLLATVMTAMMVLSLFAAFAGTASAVKFGDVSGVPKS